MPISSPNPTLRLASLLSLLTPTERRERNLRLVQLHNFLLDLPHSRFHMPRWCSADATEESCGSAGCAAGWAATKFHYLGFRLDSIQRPLFGRFPEFDGFQGTLAFAWFFGLTGDEAQKITNDFASYIRDYGVQPEHLTPAMVADRIARILSNYGIDVHTTSVEPLPSLTT